MASPSVVLSSSEDETERLEKFTRCRRDERGGGATLDVAIVVREVDIREVKNAEDVLGDRHNISL